MSTIARKLCDEIVEPALESSSKDSPTKKSSSKLMYHCPSRQDGKTTRSVVIEKKKIINKLVPHESDASRTVINKFKSKETILNKKFIDIAVNTHVTGPLRCDNNCVTMVRRRDNRCSCKCTQKRINFKAAAKQIQTFDNKNYLLTDKACAQCIETASCGTQFLERLSGSIKPQVSSGTKLETNRDVKPQPSVRESTQSNKIRQQKSSNINRPSNLGYNMGARRWALSQYPTRGPDF